ncbi:MAG TPA: DUF2330 domain-containing protein [Thermoanaerobaculia bacterium]
MKPLLIALAAVAIACAPAPHAGDEIAVVEESAVIVWDAAAKTEHFIRRAIFHGKGRDFGFLVPTPAVPILAEVDDAIFDKLEERTRPEIVHVTKRRLDFTPFLLMSETRSESMTTGAAAPVEVLSSQKVAGYDAVVLAATDAAALQKWLAGHGYASTPDLTEWLDAYVQRQWKITAFKIDAAQPAVRTAAVKMSFAAERPFFPYREPASQRRLASEKMDIRALRIWVLGDERVTGTIGEKTFWPGILRRSDPLPDALRGDVARLAKLTLAAPVRMTAFIDQSSIRPGTDELYFGRSAVQSGYVEPPRIVEHIERTRIPLDLIVLALIAIAVVWWLIRRA